MWIGEKKKKRKKTDIKNGGEVGGGGCNEAEAKHRLNDLKQTIRNHVQQLYNTRIRN